MANTQICWIDKFCDTVSSISSFDCIIFTNWDGVKDPTTMDWHTDPYGFVYDRAEDYCGFVTHDGEEYCWDNWNDITGTNVVLKFEPGTTESMNYYKTAYVGIHSNGTVDYYDCSGTVEDNVYYIKIDSKPEHLYAYTDPNAGTPLYGWTQDNVDYYTRSATPVAGMALYDSTGVATGDTIYQVNQDGTWDLYVEPTVDSTYTSIDGTTFNFNTAYPPALFAVGSNWVDLTKQNSNTVYHIDLTNTSSPVITSNAYGDVKLVNGYLSDSNGLIVGSWNSSDKIGYKLSINNSTGAITPVLNSTVSSGNRILGVTETNVVVVYSERQGTTAYYIDKIYWNGVEKYSMPQSNRLWGAYMQTGPETLAIAKTTNSELATATASGYTAQSSIQDWSTLDKVGYLQTKTDIYNSMLTITATALNGNYLFKRSNSNVVSASASHHAGADHYMWIIGAMDNKLYCIDISGWDTTNKTWTSSSVVKLLLLDPSDFSLIYEEVLPNDPFNEYSGVPTFWDNARCLASESYTGYVGVCQYNTTTNKLNIAKFSRYL